jgi:hypothetical protein
MSKGGLGISTPRSVAGPSTLYHAAAMPKAMTILPAFWMAPLMQLVRQAEMLSADPALRLHQIR